jgi:uncharacterized protein (TIGR00369 family)
MPRLIDLLDIASVPIARTLGIVEEHRAHGHVTFSMDARPEHHNPLGTVHGGVYCDLADMAMGIAMLTTLNDDEAMTTIELKINYFRPVTTGRLVADARVLHRGRTSGFIECEVRDAENRLAAKCTSTCVLLTGDRADAIFSRYRT